MRQFVAGLTLVIQSDYAVVWKIKVLESGCNALTTKSLFSSFHFCKNGYADFLRAFKNNSFGK